MMHGEPFNVIFNQNKTSFFIIFIVIYYLFNCINVTKKVYVMLMVLRKTKNEAAISFWWYCKG